jgi:hypothetical protein
MPRWRAADWGHDDDRSITSTSPTRTNTARASTLRSARLLAAQRLYRPQTEKRLAQRGSHPSMLQ